VSQPRRAVCQSRARQAAVTVRRNLAACGPAQTTCEVPLPPSTARERPIYHLFPIRRHPHGRFPATIRDKLTSRRQFFAAVTDRRSIW